MFSTFLFIFNALIFVSSKVKHYQPEQVHLSFGKTVKDIVVTWNTKNHTKSIVKYGIGKINLTAKGKSDLFVDGGSARASQYIHRVTLPSLEPNKIYGYQCGSKLGWSSKFWFRSVSNASDWSPHLAILGDLGVENAQSVPALRREAQEKLYDAILHVGDFGYDMEEYDGRRGDEFMRKIEPIAAHVPYMTCPGNHEEAYNFSHYRERFTMPSGTQNYAYSFDIGPLHIISISTESYYFLRYGIKSLIFQYEWLENDLIKANLPENRKKHPWIVIMGHRPMYCSTTDGDDCTHHETILRVGIPFLKMFGLEKLLYDYGVDLEIWAHEHIYQRLWPIYNYTVYNGSYEAPYTNPKAPVHFITGSAGCREGHNDFQQNRPPWSAFESKDYGYTRLKAYNHTHLYIEQVAVAKKYESRVTFNEYGSVVDSFWLIKNSHGPYQYSEAEFGTCWEDCRQTN